MTANRTDRVRRAQKIFGWFLTPTFVARVCRKTYTFEDLLNNETIFSDFEWFLKKQCSTENLYFYKGATTNATGFTTRAPLRFSAQGCHSPLRFVVFNQISFISRYYSH